MRRFLSIEEIYVEELNQTQKVIYEDLESILRKHSSLRKHTIEELTGLINNEFPRGLSSGKFHRDELMHPLGKLVKEGKVEKIEETYRGKVALS